MDEITLRDYRCFRGKQQARLSPLTLIVGENSTGKTSFMAMIRALWEIAYTDAIPDFKEEPFDLGSFTEIAHNRGGRGGTADSFEAGFRIDRKDRSMGKGFSFNVMFRQRGGMPIPVERHVWRDRASVRFEQLNGSLKYFASVDNTTWDTDITDRWGSGDETTLVPLYVAGMIEEENGRRRNSLDETRKEAIRELVEFSLYRPGMKPFASAPVRSRPRRTYDPARSSRDAEGDYIPMYLAHLFRRQDKKDWRELKARLEAFGKAAGLFDELHIRSIGTRESEPFQLQVRKLGQRTKGPLRNLTDVGYGVSRILPLITELLRSDAPAMFLLQQPEVHLHPSAQAALGTLFCEVARDRQLIVETHSDHLINRVRMDIRDGIGPLSPDQVSILYFERNELEVVIHSLRIDDTGNILHAPPGYGRFFMEETERSLRH